MSDIGNIPVQCPGCQKFIVVPVMASLAMDSEGIPGLVLSIDEDRWATRLQAHLKLNHG